MVDAPLQPPSAWSDEEICPEGLTGLETTATTSVLGLFAAPGVCSWVLLDPPGDFVRRGMVVSSSSSPWDGFLRTLRELWPDCGPFSAICLDGQPLPDGWPSDVPVVSVSRSQLRDWVRQVDADDVVEVDTPGVLQAAVARTVRGWLPTRMKSLLMAAAVARMGLPSTRPSRTTRRLKLSLAWEGPLPEPGVAADGLIAFLGAEQVLEALGSEERERPVRGRGR